MAPAPPIPPPPRPALVRAVPHDVATEWWRAHVAARDLTIAEQRANLAAQADRIADLERQIATFRDVTACTLERMDRENQLLKREVDDLRHGGRP